MFNSRLRDTQGSIFEQFEWANSKRPRDSADVIYGYFSLTPSY